MSRLPSDGRRRQFASPTAAPPQPASARSGDSSGRASMPPAAPEQRHRHSLPPPARSIMPVRAGRSCPAARRLTGRLGECVLKQRLGRSKAGTPYDSLGGGDDRTTVLHLSPESPGRMASRATRHSERYSRSPAPGAVTESYHGDSPPRADFGRGMRCLGRWMRARRLSGGPSHCRCRRLR